MEMICAKPAVEPDGDPAAASGCLIVHTDRNDPAWQRSDASRRTTMSGTIVNLIIQLIAGAVGGNAAGSALKDYSLGSVGNTIAGAVGGVGLGQALQALIPMLAGAAGGQLDVGAIIGQLVGGVVGGAILTVVAGLVKKMMTGKPT
jgi:hypothetical protein